MNEFHCCWPSFCPALRFFSGSSTAISSENLLAVTNDLSNTSSRVVTFNVIRQPKLGRLALRRPDNSTSDVSTFTQEMVRERLEAVGTSDGTII